jgi:hypothetical protein
MRHRIRGGLGSALGWAGALQEVENLSGLAALVGASCFLERLGRLAAFVGLLRRGGLVARPGLRRRNVGPVCRDGRLLGGGWLLGRGTGLGVGGFCCHADGDRKDRRWRWIRPPDRGRWGR